MEEDHGYVEIPISAVLSLILNLPHSHIFITSSHLYLHPILIIVASAPGKEAKEKE